MDVVKIKIAALGGTVDATSEIDKGTVKRIYRGNYFRRWASCINTRRCCVSVRRV
jgi:hypothetical protein